MSAGQCAVGEKTLRLYAFVKHFKAHGGDSNMESLSLKRLKTGMAYSMRVSLQDIYETCVDKTSDETKRFTDGRCYENRCNHLSCSPHSSPSAKTSQHFFQVLSRVAVGLQ